MSKPKQRYSVLKSSRPFGRVTSDPFGGFAAAPSGLEGPEPELQTLELDPQQLREAAAEPSVAAIAPVMRTHLVEPRDIVAPAAGANAWGIDAIGAGASQFDGNGVTVAILDTGIDAAHPAFAGVQLVQSDFTGVGNGDDHGHGTHCAGTVLGRDVGGTRIGVARGVTRALIGKVLRQGGGTSDALFQGMQWALAQGARVISMSLGFDFPGMVADLVANQWPADLATSAALEAYRGNLRMFDAIMAMAKAREMLDGGAVVIAAAGNESRREQGKQFEIAASLPACASGVIAVGAAQQTAGGKLAIASFSNTLPQISGPGVQVLSARRGGGLVMMSGTSMATPAVAGVAALWWHALHAQGNTLVSASAVTAKLLASADPNAFAPGVEVADRGMGMVKAP